MDKIGRSGKAAGDGKGLEVRQPYQTDAAQRERARLQGLDPGDDPTLNEISDGFTGPMSPRLDAITREMDHPTIGSVGTPEKPYYYTGHCSVGYTQKDKPGG